MHPDPQRICISCLWCRVFHLLPPHFFQSAWTSTGKPYSNLSDFKGFISVFQVDLLPSADISYLLQIPYGISLFPQFLDSTITLPKGAWFWICCFNDMQIFTSLRAHHSPLHESLWQYWSSSSSNDFILKTSCVSILGVSSSEFLLKNHQSTWWTECLLLQEVALYIRGPISDTGPFGHKLPCDSLSCSTL